MALKRRRGWRCGDETREVTNLNKLFPGSFGREVGECECSRNGMSVICGACGRNKWYR